MRTILAKIILYISINIALCIPTIHTVFDRTGRANTGHALETALIELERRRAENSYVKTPQGFVDLDAGRLAARGARRRAGTARLCMDADATGSNRMKVLKPPLNARG